MNLIMQKIFSSMKNSTISFYLQPTHRLKIT